MKKGFLLLLTFLMSLTLGAQNSIRYVTANLNMRTAPNTKSYIITQIPKGTPVAIEEDCDCAWIPVSYNGHIGYVSTKYLSKHKHSYHSTRPLTKTRYYTNSRGHRVQSPTRYTSAPSGATALCNDGTYSFSQSRRGTCSHHGGVAQWLR